MLRSLVTIWAAWFLIGVSSAGASVRVEYSASKIHGLIDFVMAVSGEPYHAPVFRELYIRSSLQTASSEKKLKLLEGLKPSLAQTIPRPASVTGGKIGPSVLTLIITQSLSAKDLSDLSRRSLGFLPADEHGKFFSILRAFEPVYEELVWKPNQAELLERKVKLEALAAEIHLDQLFEKAEQFYQSSWPEEVPFVVGLYPVPFLKGVPNTPVSLSLGSIEVHGVRTGLKRDSTAENFAAVFHELCHSLYESRSDSIVKTFEAAFQRSPSLARNHAHQWINEALATALGNGLAYELANKGKLDQGPWYNHATVDGFAKEIFPLVRNYVNARKPLDSELIAKAISLYSKKYPDSLRTFADVLTNFFLAHNASFLQKPNPRRALENSFFVSSYSIISPLTNAETLDSFKNHPSTAILIFSEAETQQMKNFAQQVPFLKTHLNTLLKMRNKSFFASLDRNGKAYLVIKAGTDEEYRLAVEKMKSIGKFDPLQPIYSF